MAYSGKTTTIVIGCATVFAIAGLLTLKPFKAEAVEDTYIRAFFGDNNATKAHRWCSGFISDKNPSTGFSVSFLAGWLDLDAGQRDKLDKLVGVASAALQDTRSLCMPSEQVRAGPLPQQLAQFQVQINEASRFVAAIEPPFNEFYDSLDGRQRRKLEDRNWRHKR